MIDPMRSFEAHMAHAEAVGRLAAAHAEKLSEAARTMAAAFSPSAPSPAWGPDAWFAYVQDAMQRTVLTLDVLRRRGDEFIERDKLGQPPLLDFDYETLIDGADLPRPVNYALTRIKPPSGVTIDPARRPFMIIDPRAGHGAGIGGFKPESQVGEAFEEGHAVYFLTFRPFPEPGQTLADVRDAQKHFLEEIRRRHPEAERPVVIGNCQGGWASLILASSAPDQAGPVSINGSPVSYWAGESGENPMRYLGGLTGGVAPAMLLADLGDGIFDGALLVENFETLNPANSFFRKTYNLYSKIDTEAERFLEFERWWGGFFMMTEAEIRWIVENLFIGNRLTQGEALLGAERIDLKRIDTPVVVFASRGDNITPPPQALNWIPDLYRDVNEIKARGQRIVYMVHPSIGHLGIFVSAKIAGREHNAITDTMRAVEMLPPGLYEMVLEEQPDRMHIKFAPRTIDDILAHDDGRSDEEMFAAVSRLSSFGAEFYDMAVRPLVRGMVNERTAQAFFAARRLRLDRAMVSHLNPFLGWLPETARRARADRVSVAPDNPFLAIEKAAADRLEQSMNFFRDWRDAMQELTFHAIYGLPAMRQLGAADIERRRKANAENLRSLPDVQEALAGIDVGGEAEGTVRMLELLSQARGYTRRSRLEKAMHLFEAEEPFKSMDDAERARLIHRQALVVQFEPELAKASLPRLLDTPDERGKALDFVMRVAGPEETMHPAALALYREFEGMLAPPKGRKAA
jgi:pimeloyl-ACP methyl ester carboxylesterase